MSDVEAGKMSVTFRTVVIAARLFGYSPEELMECANAKYIKPNKTLKVDRLGIGKIIQTRREKLQMTRQELFSLTGIFSEGIRITEIDFPKKVKVDTVSLLDNVLGFNGELIGITWALTEKELEEKFQFQRVADA